MISLSKKTNINQIYYYNLNKEKNEDLYKQLLKKLEIEELIDGTTVYIKNGEVLGVLKEKNESKTKELMLEVSENACDDLC